MSDFAQQFQSSLKNLDNQFSSNSLLQQFEQHSGLPKSYGILGAGAFYFVLIFLNFGGIGQLLSNIAGFAIPCYYSLLALQTATSKDDTELLTYWVVFAFLNVIEFWSKAILYWIPFYWFIKTVFLVYLCQFGGAQIVYRVVIKPVSEQYITGAPAATKFANAVDDAAEGVSSGVSRN